ncbi:hypothetical protein ACJX0J_039998, partial [Zea mays]
GFYILYIKFKHEYSGSSFGVLVTFLGKILVFVHSQDKTMFIVLEDKGSATGLWPSIFLGGILFYAMFALMHLIMATMLSLLCFYPFKKVQCTIVTLRKKREDILHAQLKSF